MEKVNNYMKNDKSAVDDDTNIFTLDMVKRCKNPIQLVNEVLMLFVLIGFAFGTINLKSDTWKELIAQKETYG